MPGVFANRNTEPEPSKCFVMMPFADSFSAIYRLIQRCCKEQDLRCERADEDVTPGRITAKIYDSVASAGIIIADMTGRNPNVFYELGLAHAMSNNVILLTQSSDDVPFDLRDFIHIQYTNSFDGAEKLATDLSKALTTLVRSADITGARHEGHKQPSRPDQPSGIDSDTVEPPDLGLFHLQAEVERKSGGDMATARGWLVKALQYASNGEGSAAEVGNCAIEAENSRFYDLAESLYEIAITRNPQHVNNRQCYVSFILDHRPTSPDKLSLAGTMLDELELVAERQERTRGLRAQYSAIIQSRAGGPINYDAILAQLLDGKDFETLEHARPALRMLREAKQYVKFREVVTRLKARLPDKETTLDRILADGLASSDDPPYEDEAVCIYERLLETGGDGSNDVRHNLASLLANKDRAVPSARALQLWKEAYAAAPADPQIRKAFAGYLLRNGMQKDAANVLGGKPLQ